MKDSQDQLMHALLSEDARLPLHTPDQDLLDSISNQLNYAVPRSQKRYWKKTLMISSLAACAAVLFFGLGLGLFVGATFNADPTETIVSYSISTEAETSNLMTSVPTEQISIPAKSFSPQDFGDFADFGAPDSFGGIEELSRAESMLQPERFNVRYEATVDNIFRSPLLAPLSTFSIDTDRASYTNLRNNINRGIEVLPDSIRVEELVNAFDYSYAPPVSEHPFAVHTEVASCPWHPDHQLVKIGLKGHVIDHHERPASNLVLLADVSGSMSAPDKLGYLKASFLKLVDHLDERDTLSIVTYAGSEGVALPPTRVTPDNKETIIQAITTLAASGGTNGSAGINLAYQLAKEHYITDGVNRVVLATDGDFNVGASSNSDLVKIVKKRAQQGTYLTVLGFGYDNLNDSMLEQITNDGNGQYFFIDSQEEGHRVFGKELSSTLITIAKDVKIQVEFNPALVSEYRLIGYANRMLRDEDFNNDRIDAGEIGAGHTVTALYEVIPGPATPAVDTLKYSPSSPAPELPVTDELMTVKLRYKQPTSTQSTLMETVIPKSDRSFDDASSDFRFASAVALYGMILRESEFTNNASLELVKQIATSALNDSEQREEFLDLVHRTPRPE